MVRRINGPQKFFSFSFWFAPSEAQSTKPQWPQSLRAEDRDGAEVADATSQYLLALDFQSFQVFIHEIKTFKSSIYQTN